jgi:hypothetical protein
MHQDKVVKEREHVTIWLVNSDSYRYPLICNKSQPLDSFEGIGTDVNTIKINVKMSKVRLVQGKKHKMFGIISNLPI